MWQRNTCRIFSHQHHFFIDGPGQRDLLWNHCEFLAEPVNFLGLFGVQFLETGVKLTLGLFLGIQFSHSVITLLNHLGSQEKAIFFLGIILMVISVLSFLQIRNSADKSRYILHEIPEPVQLFLARFSIIFPGHLKIKVLLSIYVMVIEYHFICQQTLGSYNLKRFSNQTFINLSL